MSGFYYILKDIIAKIEAITPKTTWRDTETFKHRAIGDGYDSESVVANDATHRTFTLKLLDEFTQSTALTAYGRTHRAIVQLEIDVYYAAHYPDDREGDLVLTSMIAEDRYDINEALVDTSLFPTLAEGTMMRRQLADSSLIVGSGQGQLKLVYEIEYKEN